MELLDSIKTKIAEITEIKYIDENWGQLDYYSAHPPVQWPCCLIDISDIQFTNIGIDREKTPINRQMGNCIVKITIANMKLTNTSQRAPIRQKNDAWKVLDLMEKLHQKIHTFVPITNSSPLIRQNMQRTLRDDGVQEYTITYKTEIQNV